MNVLLHLMTMSCNHVIANTPEVTAEIPMTIII